MFGMPGEMIRSQAVLSAGDPSWLCGKPSARHIQRPEQALSTSTVPSGRFVQGERLRLNTGSSVFRINPQKANNV
jgi:hypothetical protein